MGRKMIAVVAFLAGCGGSPYRKVDEADVDPEARALAQRIASNLLSTWRDGRHEALGNDATAAMRSGLPPEKQRAAYDEINGTFGAYRGLEYAETWEPTDGTLLRVYRFRGRFSGRARPEVRVVIDGNDKLAGLWVKPWATELR